jgi:uncharacterized protein (DUF58 family)
VAMPHTKSGATARGGFRGNSVVVWWVFVAVMLGVVGWLKTINVLLLVSNTLVALLGINAFLAFRMTRRISACRIPHANSFAGEEVVLMAVLTNDDTRTKSLALQEVASADIASVWFMPHIAGRTAYYPKSKVAFANRGRHPLPRLMARSGYPFGLLTYQRPLTEPGEQVVLPPLGTVNARLMKRFLLRAGHGDDRAKHPHPRFMPSEGDVRGLRPHRDGDGARDIHWKTSARRGQLMVREYDQTAPLDLVILVDPWVPSIPTDRISQRKLEWALSLALTAAWAWVHEERPGKIALIVFEETATILKGPGTPLFVREGFGKLAGIAGTPAVSTTGLGRIPALRDRAARLLVSTRPRSPIAAAIRAAGLSLAVVDPTSPARWFSLPPSVALAPTTGRGDAR